MTFSYTQKVKKNTRNISEQSCRDSVTISYMQNSVSVSFGSNKSDFWGMFLSAEGIAVDPSKVKDVLDWAAPTTVCEVQSFLGLAGYNHRFIEGFSKIAKAMTESSIKTRSLNGLRIASRALKNKKPD